MAVVASLVVLARWQGRITGNELRSLRCQLALSQASLAKPDGKQPVAKVLDRIMVNEKIVARETTRRKWTAAVRKDETSPV